MTDTIPDNLAKLIEADQAPLERLGITFVSAEPEIVILAMTVEACMTNTHGNCHGGFLFALADTAFAYVLADESRPPATLQASISFTSAARLGETVKATASISRSGRRAGFAEVRLNGADDRLIAHFQGAGIR